MRTETFKLNVADGIPDHEGSEMELLLNTERDHLSLNAVFRPSADGFGPMSSVSLSQMLVSCARTFFPNVQTPWPRHAGTTQSSL